MKYCNPGQYHDAKNNMDICDINKTKSELTFKICLKCLYSVKNNKNNFNKMMKKIASRFSIDKFIEKSGILSQLDLTSDKIYLFYYFI